MDINVNNNNDDNGQIVPPKPIQSISRIPSRILPPSQSRLPSSTRLPSPSRLPSSTRLPSPSRLPSKKQIIEPLEPQIETTANASIASNTTNIVPSSESKVKATVQSIEQSIAKKESRLPLSPSLSKKMIQLSPIKKNEITNIESTRKSKTRQNVRFDNVDSDDEEQKTNNSKETRDWNSSPDESDKKLEYDTSSLDNNINQDHSSIGTTEFKKEDGFFLRIYKELAGIDPDEEDEDETFFHFVQNTLKSYSKSILSWLLGDGPVFVDEIYNHITPSGEKRAYKLNIFQRVFVTLENPGSCQIGQNLSILMFSIIILSCIDYIIATLPQLNFQPETCDTPVCSYDTECPNAVICEPIPPTWLNTVELACVILFSIEYGARMLLIGTVPPRLADLIPSHLSKFKLENEMINDEQSLFNFTKRSLQGTKTAVGKIQKQASIDHIEEADANCDESLKEVIDVSHFTFNTFTGEIYEKLDLEVSEQDTVWTKMSKISKKMLFPRLKLLDPLDSKLVSSRINERLDMPWYIRIMKYQFSIMNLIDVCAILPYYIQLATTSSSSLSFIRLLRLARIFRVLKVGKSTAGVRIIVKALKKAASALGIVTFFIPLGIVFFGSVVFLFESGEYTVSEDFPDGAWVRQGQFGESEESPYTSIPTSMYWAVVTSTTTGYGELVPTTLPGRILAIFCMYYGVLLMALPITVIGNNFTREYEKFYGNSAERMVYECLLDIAKVTNDETVMRAQGIIPIDSTEFKLTRLALIITTFDNTKRDALKRSLISNIRKRKKAEQYCKAPNISNINSSTESLLNKIYDAKENKDKLKDILKKLTESMSSYTNQNYNSIKRIKTDSNPSNFSM